jgi:chromosome segregation ATPase
MLPDVDKSELHIILERADGKLTTLGQRQQDIEQQIRETQEAIATLEIAKEKAWQVLTHKKEALAEAEREQEQASGYAKLAHGTVNEQASVKRVTHFKKQSDTLRREISQKEKQITGEVETRREQELRAKLAQLHTDREAIGNEIEQTTGARSQAHNELGSLRLSAALDQLAEHTKQIDTLKDQILAAQVSRQECIEQALSTLQDWPRHLGQLREAYPSLTDDTVCCMVQAMLYYLETLLNANQGVNQLFALAFQKRLNVPANLLPFYAEIQPNTFQPRFFRMYQEQLTQFLADYQACRAKG